MHKIGCAQFRVMCDMWGVDEAIKTAKQMGMVATDEQIKAEREKEKAYRKRWHEVFKEST